MRPDQNHRLVIQAAASLYQILRPNPAEIGPNWLHDSTVYTREGVVTEISMTVYDPRFFGVKFFAPDTVRRALSCEYLHATA